MTEKLYWADPHRTTFTSTVRAFTSRDGRPSVMLERSLFYPEGGGQLGDVGTLRAGGRTHAVVDTQIDDAGVIHHLLAEPPAEPLAGEVEGTIDATRRRDHMAQHTAQHALSRALADLAKADTVSARLGATSCTIDVARPGIPDAELHRAEDLVNELIASDVAVRALYPTAEELPLLKLRKQPKVTEGTIRVIDIEGFDLTPCGGTHCTRTGQIGQARIVALEKYKGMLRITFHAGLRALTDARAKHAALAALAADLTCGVADVPAAVTRLRADLKNARASLDAARGEIATLLATSVLASLPEGPGPHVLPLERPGDDVNALRKLANELTTDPRVLTLLAAPDAATGELSIVVQRGSGVAFDAGAFIKAQCAERGTRGGGRPERGEARFPTGTTLDALTTAARALL
ncbi:MAG: alanyl-tRNA editing protein [Labilithrix sp.]|nr:alanyl-tRNA editing protein [Labilithrix sp.]MCW5814565.1 alanyl-tRNA editing protein [Labilithrix sp.]